MNKRTDTVIRIELDLRKHCIATEVKRLHNRRISDYFKGRGSREALEGEINLLARALDELDLPALRGRHRLLAGGGEAEVVLFGSADLALSLILDGEPLDLSDYEKR